MFYQLAPGPFDLEWPWNV